MVKSARNRVGYVSFRAPIGRCVRDPDRCRCRCVFFLNQVNITLKLGSVSLLGSLGATSLIMQRQALWLEAIERRIAATNAMLNSMKGVKMGGLTDVLRTDLQQLRIEELNISKKFRKLMIWTMGFCKSPPYWDSVVLLTKCSLHFTSSVPYPCIYCFFARRSKQWRI